MVAQRRRHLIALVLAMAVLATACGGASNAPPEQLRASSLQPDSASEPVPWGVEPTIAPMPGEAAVEREPVGEPVVATEVLTLAFAAPEDLSYSFTQGISIEMDMPGVGGFSIAPTDAVAWGEVSGSRNHTVFDMGVVMREALAGFGAGSSFDDATMEIWSDESTLVMDMSPLASALGAVDPIGAGELGLLADGPVRIDLTQTPGLTGAEFASQYAQGSQVVDPGLLLQSLRSVNAITSVGPDQHKGVPVEAYVASISMAEYYDALGMDINAQLEGTADLGLNGDDQLIADAVLGAMESLDVQLRILIDDDQLIRRLETVIDMQPMMAALFEDPTVLESMAAAEGASVESMAAGAAFITDMQYTVGSWQDFDNYGGAFDITFPDAVDRTAEFNSLFDDLTRA